MKVVAEPRQPTAVADPALLHLLLALDDHGYRFITVTPATHARVNARPGNAWAEDLADVFGWSRPFRAGVLPSEIFDSLRATGAVEQVDGGWRSLVRVSSLGETLYLHSAYPTAGAGSVFFGPDTYRFVAAIEAYLNGRKECVRRAVDIGCGAGPGAVSIALRNPAAEVAALDINPLALRYAAASAAAAGADNVRAAHSDLLNDTRGEFDLIVANPPYLLDPAKRSYRHGGGTSGEGLSLAILDQAIDRLAPGGTLVLYTGVAIFDGHDRFLEAADARLRDYPGRWAYRELDPDVFGEELDLPTYADADRIAAVLLELKRQT